MCEYLFYSICPRCTYFSAGQTDLYCPTCGVLLSSRCGRCGTDIRDPYAIFCRACGTLYRPPVPLGETGTPGSRGLHTPSHRKS